MDHRSYCGNGHLWEGGDASLTTCPICGAPLYSRCARGHTFWVSGGACGLCRGVRAERWESFLGWIRTTPGFLTAATVLAVVLIADAGAMGYTVNGGGGGGTSPAGYAAPYIPSPTTPSSVPSAPVTPTTSPGSKSGTAGAGATGTGTAGKGTAGAGATGTGTTAPTQVPPPQGSPPAPMPASVVDAVASIPAHEFDSIGVSATPPVGGLHPLSNQLPLVVDGKPGVFFMGDEWCPFCAAERWALVAALSRFGTFSSLGSVTSSSKDIDPSTPSFSFDGSTYTSPYLSFESVELESTQTDSQGQYLLLQTPTPAEDQIVNAYETTALLGAGWTPGSVPFIDVGNDAIFAGSAFSPSLLAGQTAQQVAAGLTDTTLPATRSIVAAANVLAAEICRSTGQQPTSVCASPGVQAAGASVGG